MPNFYKKALVKVVSDLLNKSIQTKDVWDIDARSKYLNTLKEADLLPDLSTHDEKETVDVAESSQEKDKEDVSGESDDTDGDEGYNEAEKDKKSTKPKAVKRGREYIFSNTFTFNNKNERIVDIYNELTRIKVTENPNSVVLLLRAFVEMVVKQYDRKFDIKSTGKNIPLREALKKTVDHYNSRFENKDEDFRGIVEACDISNISSIFSIESFQQLVHRDKLKPIVTEVMDRWDNIEPGIILLIEKI